MEVLSLQNGVLIPAVGYGTWQLPAGQATADAISAALSAGYRLFDTAASYGNELKIGKALRESGLPRAEVFLSGKLWNTQRAYAEVPNAFTQSLKRLKTDFLDLYLIHWPASPQLYPDWEQRNAETWRAMEELYRIGVVKAIGVCNFKAHALKALLKTAAIPPMVNQIELHPGQIDFATLEFCRTHGILVEAWSPLGSGGVLQNEALAAIAAAHDKSVAQICLRWAVQQGIVPLPRSANPARMRENLALFDFSLSAAEMAQINTLPCFAGSGLDPDTLTEFG